MSVGCGGHKGVSRKRSKSNSPYVRKKPKPLPRKALTAKQVLNDEARNNIFLSSLPANFKPVPLPRGGTSKSLASPAREGASEFNTPQCDSSSGASSPRKKDISNSSTPKVSSPSPTTTATTPRYEYSSPNTPSHAPPDPSPKHILGSPLYTSSNSNLSSDAESSTSTRRQDTAMTSDPSPIPPPRRRRRSKYGSQSSCKELVQSVGLLPTSPEEPLSCESRRLKSCDHSRESCDQHDGRASPPTTIPIDHSSPPENSFSSTSTKSHDLDDSESSKSHDLTNEEDLLSSPLLEEANDVFVPDATPTLPTHLTAYGAGERNSQYSVSSARTSRTSLTVFPGSTSSSVVSAATLRPLSFMSPGDSAHHFNFSESCERSFSSGGHTMPRSVGGQTWTPHMQARASVKSMVPASSK